MRIDFQLVYLIWACLVAGPAAALPIAPTRDDEVVEVLPAAGSGSRAEEKRLRRELARRPDDARLAVDVARRHLDQAREQGDARFVGLAFAALQRWSDPASDPPPVVLMQAVLLQYQHDFDRAGALLEQLLQRQPKDAQAWLTLATVRRVQGRYAESDAACRSLPAAAPDLYPRACMAENAALRGRVDEARSTFHELLAGPGLDLATRGWLLTSLAELEERAGRAAAAGGEWRAALRADPGPYTALGYADFLIAGGQPQTALAVLAGLPRSDAVVLRLAIAGTRCSGPMAHADTRDMGERIALANQRPGTQSVHGREQAMFALWVERQPARALALARENVARQREPVDLLLLAQAARAAGNVQALNEARMLRSSIGLHDARLDALL